MLVLIRIGTNMAFHTNLYKFSLKVSPHILHTKHYCDLKLGESLCIFTFFLFSESGLYLLNGFDFYFEWRDTENQQLSQTNMKKQEKPKIIEPMVINFGSTATLLKQNRFTLSRFRNLQWEKSGMNSHPSLLRRRS